MRPRSLRSAAVVGPMAGAAGSYWMASYYGSRRPCAGTRGLGPESGSPAPRAAWSRLQWPATEAQGQAEGFVVPGEGTRRRGDEGRGAQGLSVRSTGPYLFMTLQWVCMETRAVLV